MRNYIILCAVLAASGCAVNNNSAKATSGCEEEEMEINGTCLTAEQQQRIGLQCEFTVVTGSRLPVKQCTTAVQRAAAKEAARDMVDRMQQQGQSAESQD